MKTPLYKATYAHSIQEEVNTDIDRPNWVNSLWIVSLLPRFRSGISRFSMTTLDVPKSVSPTINPGSFCNHVHQYHFSNSPMILIMVECFMANSFSSQLATYQFVAKQSRPKSTPTQVPKPYTNSSLKSTRPHNLPSHPHSKSSPY